jgi:osmoprotectant transport system substrate-binding protein
LSNLAKPSGSLKFAALTACTGRMDCLEGLKKVYGINFKSVQSLDSQALIYSALTGGQADVAEVFGTDAQIKADNLVVLADNKGIAPADHIAPVVRNSTLAKYKDIPSILNPLARYLTSSAMIKMNAQVGIQHANPLNVARAFLKSKHLI